MESKDRTVSVVMCTYNGAKYLREQLDSIVRQTYPVLELIIQDDGSTDGTKDILDEYGAKYPNISVYYNDPPKGINGNFISCIRRAKGDYIAISDQDDIWEADKIAVQMEQIGNRMFSSGFSKPFATKAGGGRNILRRPQTKPHGRATYPYRFVTRAYPVDKERFSQQNTECGLLVAMFLVRSNVFGYSGLLRQHIFLRQGAGQPKAASGSSNIYETAELRNVCQEYVSFRKADMVVVQRTSSGNERLFQKGLRAAFFPSGRSRLQERCAEDCILSVPSVFCCLYQAYMLVCKVSAQDILFRRKI